MLGHSGPKATEFALVGNSHKVHIQATLLQVHTCLQTILCGTPCGITWAVAHAFSMVRIDAVPFDLPHKLVHSRGSLMNARALPPPHAHKHQAVFASCRLDSKRRAADQAEYDALVADVTKRERESKATASFLPTARLQMSQGIHVIVTMGLGYALGTGVGGTSSILGPSTVRIDLAWSVYEGRCCAPA